MVVSSRETRKRSPTSFGSRGESGGGFGLGGAGPVSYMFTESQAPESGKLGISNWLFDISVSPPPHSPGYSVSYWANHSDGSSASYGLSHRASNSASHWDGYSVNHGEGNSTRNSDGNGDGSSDGNSGSCSASCRASCSGKNSESNLVSNRLGNSANCPVNHRVNYSTSNWGSTLARAGSRQR